MQITQVFCVPEQCVPALSSAAALKLVRPPGVRNLGMRGKEEASKWLNVEPASIGHRLAGPREISMEPN